jgi:hypothetical protein
VGGEEGGGSRGGLGLGRSPRCRSWGFQYKGDGGPGWAGKSLRGLISCGSLARHLGDGRKGGEKLRAEIWRARSMVAVYGHIDVGRGRSVYGLTGFMVQVTPGVLVHLIAQEWERACECLMVR